MSIHCHTPKITSNLEEFEVKRNLELLLIGNCLSISESLRFANFQYYTIKDFEFDGPLTKVKAGVQIDRVH